jgi:hypothetical protein
MIHMPDHPFPDAFSVENDINPILDCLLQFYKTDKLPHFLFADNPDEMKVETVKFLESCLNDNSHRFGVLDWKLDYGALLLRTVYPHDRSKTSIDVLCLDGWKFTIQTCQNGAKENLHTSTPSATATCLSVGTILTDQLDDFTKLFDSIFSEAEKLSGKLRSAKNVEGGHQKTPGFVHAKCSEALNQLNSEKKEPIIPSGGWTDVGLHTGGRVRYTAFPLVRSLLHEWYLFIFPKEIDFESVSDSFEYFLALFEISLLEYWMKEITSMQHNSAVDIAMSTLFSISSHLCNLKHVDESLRLETSIRCISVRDALEKFSNEYHIRISENYVLKCPSIKDFVDISSPQLSFRDFDEKFDEKSSNLTDYIALGLKNLSIQAFPQSGFDRKNLDDWRCKWVSTIHAQELYIQFFEDLMFRSISKETKMDLDQLITSFDKYQGYYDEFVKRQDKIPSLYPQQKNVLESRNVLIHWIVYCLVHINLISSIPLVEKYNVALSDELLANLVLNDRKSIEALCAICNYLRKHHVQNQATLFSGVYSLLEGTEDFILKYFDQNIDLVAKLKETKEAHELSIKNRWKEIESRRKKCKDLEDKIAQRERDYALAYQKEREAYMAWSSQHTTEYYIWVNKETICKDVKKKIDELKSELKNTRYYRHPIFSRIPDDKNEGKLAIFLMNIPNPLYQLLEMGYRSMKILMSFNSDFPMNWSTRKKNVGVKEFHFAGDPDPERRDFPEEDVDTWNERDHLWYPGKISYEFFRCKRDGKYENPFNLLQNKMELDSSTSAVKYLQFPRGSGLLTLFDQTPGFSTIKQDRANVGIARQSEIRSENITMSKVNLLSHTDLRSYPLTQVYNLFAGVKDGTLDLNDSKQHGLFLHTLQQIGIWALVLFDCVLEDAWWIQVMLPTGLSRVFFASSIPVDWIFFLMHSG